MFLLVSSIIHSFLTLASVLVIFPTFSNVRFTFFDEGPLATRYAIYSFDFSKESSSDEQILLILKGTPFQIPSMALEL